MPRIRSTLLLLAASWFLLACTLRSPVQPGIAKRDWLELRSAHFVMTTDLPRERAIERIAELEQLWQALAELYVIVVPGKAPPSTTMQLVHLRRNDDFKLVIWRDGIGGFVESTHDFEQARLVVTCEESQARTEILLHELAHNFNHFYFAHSPAWLNEGLATYYQTISVDRDKAVVGRPSLMDSRYYWSSSRWLPGLRKLLDMSYDEFYEGKRQHYFAAWKAVHLLSTSAEDYHRRFRRYLALLGAGANNENAWTEAFAGIPFKKLSAEYKKHQRRYRIKLWKVPFKPQAIIRDPVIRRLRPGEVHARWAQLQMIRAHNKKPSKPNLGPVRAHLDLAARDDANWSGTTFWRAALEFQAKAPQTETLRLLRKYLAAEPNDARARLGVLRARMRAIVPEDYVGLGPEPLGLAELEADVMELVRVSQTAAELHQIAWYFALRKNSATGLSFVRRALAADPGCAACMDTHALLLFHAGRAGQALALQRQAMNMMDEDEVSAGARQRLEHYRMAAGKRDRDEAKSGQ